jgi:hypothetical protein
MDLFNTKKLVEKEGKLKELEYQIQQLKSDNQKQQEKLSELNATIEKLHQEMKKNQQLHDDVVDTMIGEIQGFMVDNHEKKLKFKSLDTLFPLIKEQIDNHYLKLNLHLDLPMIATHKGDRKFYEEQSISAGKVFIEGWIKEGIIEQGVVQKVICYELEWMNLVKISVLTKYCIDDAILKMKSNKVNIYDFELSDDSILQPERLKIEKESEDLITVNVYYSEPR